MVGKRLTDNMGKGSLTDLEVIDGIGRAKADILRANDVTDLERLARFASPLALLEHLHRRGVTRISLSQIENASGTGGDWCTQARRLVRAARPVRSTPKRERERNAAAHHPAEDHTAATGTPAAESESTAPAPGTAPAPAAAGAARNGATPAARFTVTNVEAAWRPTTIETGPEHIVASVEAELTGPGSADLMTERTPFVVVLASVEPGKPPHVLRVWPGRFEPGTARYTFTGSFLVPPVGRHETIVMVAGASPAAACEPASGPVLNVFVDA